MTTPILALLLLTGVASGSWPQWLGPDRDGTAEALAVAAGDVAFEVVWRRPLATGGYSGIAIDQGVAYTMISDGEEDHVIALKTADGAELWRHRVDVTFEGVSGSHTGPLSTPLVAGDTVYALGPHGKLTAIARSDGARRWQVDLTAEHGGRVPYFGYATSPLLVGDRIVVLVGGEERAIAAFERRDGAVAWSAVEGEEVEYGSPILAAAGGSERIWFATKTHLHAIAAADGAASVRLPIKGFASATPLALTGDRLFLGGDDEGALVSVAADPEALWTKPTIKRTQSPAVHRDGVLYGFNGKYVTAVDAATGKAYWKGRQKTDGTLILAEDHLVVLSQNGRLSVVRASPEAYTERAALELLGKDSFTGPSVAEGRIFVRGLTAAACVQLVAAPAASEPPAGP